MNKKGTLKVCSRGHQFYKSSDCPVCPICWPGNRKKLLSDFPEDLAALALRALSHAKIGSLQELSNYTEKEIANLHGIGPNAIEKLRNAMEEKGIRFKK